MTALHKWDKNEWAIHLVPLLTGKAFEAYSRLSDGESGRYDKIKEAILKRYELTSEAYREKFRQARQQSDESFKDYQVRTEKYLSHWCKREYIHGQYNSMYDLVLREQLLKFCDKDLQVWVHEHRPKNVKEVIDLVEAYQTAYKRSTFGGIAEMEQIEILKVISMQIRGKLKLNKEKARRSKKESVPIVRGLGISRENVLFTTDGSIENPRTRKLVSLGCVCQNTEISNIQRRENLTCIQVQRWSNSLV